MGIQQKSLVAIPALLLATGAGPIQDYSSGHDMPAVVAESPDVSAPYAFEGDTWSILLIQGTADGDVIKRGSYVLHIVDGSQITSEALPDVTITITPAEGETLTPGTRPVVFSGEPESGEVLIDVSEVPECQNGPISGEIGIAEAIYGSTGFDSLAADYLVTCDTVELQGNVRLNSPVPVLATYGLNQLNLSYNQPKFQVGAGTVSLYGTSVV